MGFTRKYGLDVKGIWQSGMFLFSLDFCKQFSESLQTIYNTVPSSLQCPGKWPQSYHQYHLRRSKASLLPLYNHSVHWETKSFCSSRSWACNWEQTEIIPLSKCNYLWLKEMYKTMLAVVLFCLFFTRKDEASVYSFRQSSAVKKIFSPE